MSSGFASSADLSSLPPESSTVAELELAARSHARGGVFERLKGLVAHTVLPRLAIGAASGCLATVAMTAEMLGLQQVLPPREQYPLPPRRIIDVLARRLGILHDLDRAELDVATAIGHFGYGTTMGALYGPLGLTLPLPGVVSGIGYGLLVWAGSYLGLLPALGILRPATKHPAGRNALMIGAHVVWGASLGWLAHQIAKRTGQC